MSPNFLWKCLVIRAVANVAVPTPERIYPPHTRITLFILPNELVPSTAYPLLVNAFETMTKASSKSTPSVNGVRMKLKNTIPINNKMLIPNPFDSVY